MKKIYIVFVIEKENKYFARPETIRTGENLKPFFDRYPGKIAHLCESATQAHNIAAAWNEQYKENGTNLY